MIIFDRDGKTNFVDNNNVFVGFDAFQCCCENWGYSLRSSKPTSAEEAMESTWLLPTDGFQFDPNFFEDVPDPEERLDCGGAVIFRLTHGTLEIFLSLYNCHNGYYAHGFTATVGGQPWQSGSL